MVVEEEQDHCQIYFHHICFIYRSYEYCKKLHYKTTWHTRKMHENLHKIRDCFKFWRYPSTEIVVCNISVEKLGLRTIER